MKNKSVLTLFLVGDKRFRFWLGASDLPPPIGSIELRQAVNSIRETAIKSHTFMLVFSGQVNVRVTSGHQMYFFFLANSNVLRAIAIISIRIMPRKKMESFIHVPVKFFNQMWPKVNRLDSRGYKMKNYRFSLICFQCLLVLYDIHEDKNVIIVFA